MWLMSSVKSGSCRLPPPTPSLPLVNVPSSYGRVNKKEPARGDSPCRPHQPYVQKLAQEMTVCTAALPRRLAPMMTSVFVKL